MDFRKLELNKMKLELQETDLVVFLPDIIQAFSGFAKQHHIDCRMITKEAALSVWIDPEKIEKVFFNILSNAFKFTGDEGFIHVFIEKDGLKNEAIISIQDSGTGIGKEEQGHVFEMFYQAGYNNNKGSGLGLALSKELIDLHKGKISVESEKDKGARFTVCLKLGNQHFSEEQIHTAKQAYSSKVSTWIENYYSPETQIHLDLTVENDNAFLTEKGKRTVLIVEDHADLRDFLTQRLSSQYYVVTANDGAEGYKSV